MFYGELEDTISVLCVTEFDQYSRPQTMFMNRYWVLHVHFAYRSIKMRAKQLLQQGN